MVFVTTLLLIDKIKAKPELQFTCFEGITYLQGANQLAPAYALKEGKAMMVPCGKKEETTTTTVK